MEQQHGVPLLTVDGVCAALSVSRTTVYRLVNRGELLPVRIGGVVRFRPRDLEALVERHTPEKNEDPGRHAEVPASAATAGPGRHGRE